MDTQIDRRNGRMATASQLRVMLLAAVILTVSGCDGLLDVTLPGEIPASALDDPAMAETLTLSAIADFECAFANYVMGTGLLTDELRDSTGWIAVTVWNQRRIDDTNGGVGGGSCTGTGPGIARPLHTARFQADDHFTRLEGFSDAEVPNRGRQMATVAAYAGYSYTLLGEAFCEQAVDGGPLLTPTELLEIAEARFSTAIQLAQAEGADEIYAMARVGRARVNLNLGRHAAAVADAETVREDFVLHATYSGASSRRRNRVAWDNHQNLWISVYPTFRNLEVDGVPDPRVPTEDAGRKGHDGVTDVWYQLKYVTEGDPIPVATWSEAQLIIAEVEGGQAAVDAINRLRDKAGLAHFNSTDPEEIHAQVVEERRRELYLQGHRLNDILRLPELDFPQGFTEKGAAYGSTTCLPLSRSERLSNPNIPD